MQFKVSKEDQTNHRYSGVLCHPTSFPSPYGIGDLGQGAYDFIDFLASAGQHLWHILPLCPTTWGDSPYQGEMSRRDKRGRGARRSRDG